MNHSFVKANWPVEHALAFMTTRRHPNQLQPIEQPYDSFNLGLHVGDNEVQVKKNRDTLQSFLPAKTNIQWLNQVHGNDVAVIEHVSGTAITADAAITRKKGIALAVMTADCLPILLTDNKGEEIAAIHGGWRPLAQDIINQTLKCMHSASNSIYAWLGPCIGNKAFEVGEDVKQAFLAIAPQFAQAFSALPNHKYVADLHHIASLQLQRAGVHLISSTAECTVHHGQKYYSYRRENTTGRMASVITLL